MKACTRFHLLDPGITQDIQTGLQHRPRQRFRMPVRPLAHRSPCPMLEAGVPLRSIMAQPPFLSPLRLVPRRLALVGPGEQATAGLLPRKRRQGQAAAVVVVLVAVPVLALQGQDRAQVWELQAAAASVGRLPLARLHRGCPPRPSPGARGKDQAHNQGLDIRVLQTQRLVRQQVVALLPCLRYLG